MRMSDIMSHLNLALYPTIGMILFLGAYAGAMWLVVGRKRQSTFDRAAQLPLEDDKPRTEARR